MSRKSGSFHSYAASKVKSAAKRALRREAGKGVRKAARKIPWKYRSVILLIVLLTVAGIMIVPENMVPAPLAAPHGAVLAWRNKMIRLTRLPVSVYPDSYTVSNPGSDAIRVFFAPSPKICPALCGFLRSAVHTVDVCAFDLKLIPVAEALIEAKRRGVEVRVVTDTDYMHNEAVNRLSRAGVPVVSDRRKSLMHNKFIVVDSRYVWTGSYNLTDNGTWRNDNNAILIESPSAAAGYRARFEQYWHEKFSTAGERTPGSTETFTGHLPIRYAFSPTDKIRDLLLHELSQARESVDVMAFSFTGVELAVKLRELCKRGIRVRCLFDSGQAKNRASRDGYLRKIGAQVFYSPNRTGKMHHKVFIIDRKTVITGSYNFSKNAESRNDENILLLRSSALAGIYAQEMDRCIRGIKGY